MKEDDRQYLGPTAPFSQTPIAVVGMACHLPGHNNSPQALWEFLMRNGVADRTPPPNRWNLEGHFDGSDRSRTLRLPGGMFIEDSDPADFDPKFFNCSTQEAICMEPQQRMLLEVVYEGLENAGISLEKLANQRYGCFVGSWTGDYWDIHARDPESRPGSFSIGNGRTMTPNRISHFLNIQGPSMAIDTACSAGLVSMDIACRYLNSGEIDGAIVAASNLYLSPELGGDVGSVRMTLSATGLCHTFDAKADGYMKSEAINCLILKRLDTALRDGDPIRAVIRGCSNGHNGHTHGISTPSVEQQAATTLSAYRNANISEFGKTIYLECHGTGTSAGDPTEVLGASQVFASSRAKEKPLILGSIKSNIGHSEAAAGISGMIKAVLAMEHGVIPGNPTFKTPNPNIDFENLKMKTSQMAMDWPPNTYKRASVNSFGLGGSNAHAIVDHPIDMLGSSFIPNHKMSIENSEMDLDSLMEGNDGLSTPHLLAFSANDEQSLKSYVKELDKHLSRLDVSCSLQDLAFTLSERRSHFFHRGYYITDSTQIRQSEVLYGKKSVESPLIGFVFTGQGAQWPEMGRGLLSRYPIARDAVDDMDKALGSLPSASSPAWSLSKELTESRPLEHMRQPEYSQPLTTALQIALVDVLRDWGVLPQIVVGHSSGEIAAAYAAGILTRREAIVIAYHRGLASKIAKPRGHTLGMLAVGADEAFITPVLKDFSAVRIACYNSPKSLTLSGDRDQLERIQGFCKENDVFSRVLQVDMAYHSSFMAEIAEAYGNLLKRDIPPRDYSAAPREASMVSSVDGRVLLPTEHTDIEYWSRNLVSPVRFEEAMRALVTSPNVPINYLIEIGPSGALSGPIKQIFESLGGHTPDYTPVLTRGDTSGRSILDLAGKLWARGMDIDMGAVNVYSCEAGVDKPLVIVDLPNYCWNHSQKYWSESISSRDWRFKPFIYHDLLGSKVLGSPWRAPVFKSTLSLEDIPYLREHRIGSDIIFPGSGYLAMAVEAMWQCAKMTRPDELAAVENVTQLGYRIRNAKFDRALILEEGRSVVIRTTLFPINTSGDGWFQYIISSWDEGAEPIHASGLIMMDRTTEKPLQRNSDQLSPLQNTLPGRLWVKAALEAGFNFGPAFHRLLAVERSAGSRSARSYIDIEPPKSAQKGQSQYPLHPAVLDGMIQAISPAIWKGDRSSVNKALIPTIMDELQIPPQDTGSLPKGHGVAISNSFYSGRGRPDQAKSYKGSISLFNPTTGLLMGRISGMGFHQMEMGSGRFAKHSLSRSVWRPDWTFLHLATNTRAAEGFLQLRSFQSLLDLAAFKKPALKVLELNLLEGYENSFWLDANSDEGMRTLYDRFTYATPHVKTLATVHGKFEGARAASFTLLDPYNPQFDDEYDLAIVQVMEEDIEEPPFKLEPVMEAVSDATKGANCRVLLVSCDRGAEYETGARENGKSMTAHRDGMSKTVTGFWNDAGYSYTRFENLKDAKEAFLFVPRKHSQSLPEAPDVNSISQMDLYLFYLLPTDQGINDMVDTLRSANYNVMVTTDVSAVPDNATVVIADEMNAPVLRDITESQWEALKTLLAVKLCKLLWVTTGASGKDITNPNAAMIPGLLRVVRLEDPSIHPVTLDVETAGTHEALEAIVHLLDRMNHMEEAGVFECDFSERGGVLYINRVTVDEKLNIIKARDEVSTELEEVKFRTARETVRLRAEKPGDFQSLTYTKIEETDEIEDGHVEVEVIAAGLAFKDVVVSMGIVPENEHLIGLEAAGVVSRVGTNSGPHRPGDRVAVLAPGSIANRMHAPKERVVNIPDFLSFSDACGMLASYATVIYSLVDVAGLKRGQTVLIHSAAGGVGIAAIQLAQHIGAEVYATVGTDEKREFLSRSFGIPGNRIFSSRDEAFAPRILEATSGKGVDVILNVLTGNLLDASWRLTADGGTFVELGKKDIIQRNMLSMEPFDRNCSYRAIDMSFASVISNETLQRLLNQMMNLVKMGAIGPISPTTCYPFSQVIEAFSALRSGRNFGKIVITDGDEPSVDTTLPVRPLAQRLDGKLRGDVSYLIIGGLKGLCGSLAVHLASRGAKHIISLSRSGIQDIKSQGVVADCTSLGAIVHEFRGDVSQIKDVRAAFSIPGTPPVGGIIQGAMVLRDVPFENMTHVDFMGACSPKVSGTWNLHRVSHDELQLRLDFFTLLSSFVGVIGNKGQANYCAANTFLDAFAHYRRNTLGLAANSIDLGPIEDVGVIEDQERLRGKLDVPQWTSINEAALHLILDMSIAQQSQSSSKVLNETSAAQLITGLATPQPADTPLLADARFQSLLATGASASGANSGSANSQDPLAKQVQHLLTLHKTNPSADQLLQVVLDTITMGLQKILRLQEGDIEPGKPLSTLGLDSLAAVEVRNWIRREITAELSTLEIMSSSSLWSLGEKAVKRLK